MGTGGWLTVDKTVEDAATQINDTLATLSKNLSPAQFRECLNASMLQLDAPSRDYRNG